MVNKIRFNLGSHVDVNPKLLKGLSKLKVPNVCGPEKFHPGYSSNPKGIFCLNQCSNPALLTSLNSLPNKNTFLSL